MELTLILNSHFSLLATCWDQCQCWIKGLRRRHGQGDMPGTMLGLGNQLGSIFRSDGDHSWDRPNEPGLVLRLDQLTTIGGNNSRQR
ncbi:hypothetical protein L484_003420 [Morus notabilis]|uniref:Uncharacterized protein n=1 Tax=Morus notabilis TaxID=981085 RepID=W9SQN4_9ROSA|nr:hypothetical protein L484_003420 [Morus notabilis]